MVSVCHKMNRPPRVYQDRENVWYLSVSAVDSQLDIPGYLARAAWISRADLSACVWLHVSTDSNEGATWTVLDEMTAKRSSINSFWREVCNKSKGQEYMVDRVSARETHDGAQRSDLSAILQTLSQDNGVYHYPEFFPASAVSGQQGLAELDKRLMATLSLFPKNDWWQDRPEEDPNDFAGDDLITIWPEAVMEAFREARYKEKTVTQDDLAAPEGLVGDGGAILRCLRLHTL